MILSVSRRTDIPACYADWFFNRLREGFVCVRTPRNPHRIIHVSLGTESVDGIVFWSKNPAPMLERLSLLKQYTYYFQFTVTPYGYDVEPNVPDKAEKIVPVFRRISDAIGPMRVIWRYDPILLNPRYDLKFHLSAFETFSKALEGYTGKCIFSFADDYKGTRRNQEALALKDISYAQQRTIARAFSEIAKSHGIAIETCAEEIDLSEYNIGHARCVDKQLLEYISGHALNVKKAQGQRRLCGCAQSIDIGIYNSCKNGCLYCYANYSLSLMRKNISLHDNASSLLCGHVKEGDVLQEKRCEVQKAVQLRLPQ